MANSAFYSIAPYTGELSEIDKFYSILGVNSVNGIIKDDKFQFIYGRNGLNVSCFQLVVEVNKDLTVIENALAEEGYDIMDSGYDGAGPYLLVEDPSGITVRVGVP